MTRFARAVRLLPVVILAIGSLLALKVSGFVLGSGYTLGERLANNGKAGMTVTSADSVPAYPKIVVADSEPETADGRRLSWAQQMFNYGDGDPDITGSVSEESKDKGPALKVSQKPPSATRIEESGGAIAVAGTPGKITSPGEEAVLRRLQQRRKELDARSHALDMRENLLKAAEKRIAARVAELKDLEAKVSAAADQRDKDEAQRFQDLVSMYQTMRAKDAARIFDHLDLGILVEVATKMKPRAMSEILAQMNPQVAERLTVELAARTNSVKAQNTDQLPKIEGRPAGT